ncbi:MAG: hypothetical protein ACKVZH_19940 [Blastocatellia bacterium]
MNDSDKLINELIELWADAYPVGGYSGGLEAWLGKLWTPTADAIKSLNHRIHLTQPKLKLIASPDLRGSAIKLLNSILTDFAYPLPDRQVSNCAQGVMYILLKSDWRSELTVQFLKQTKKIVAFETEKWAGQSFSIERRKLCLETASELSALLVNLQKQNPTLATLVDAVNSQLVGYKKLFDAPGLETEDFDKLFAIFECETTGPTITPGYDSMLKDLYDLLDSPETIHKKNLAWLKEEMPLVRQTAQKVAEHLRLTTDSKVQVVYSAMSKHYAFGKNVLSKAATMMKAANDYVAEFIQQIIGGVRLEEAPADISSMITGGATIPLNFFTDKPNEVVYLNPGKNASKMTTLNVLCHEYTHAWQAGMAARNRRSPLLRVQSTLIVPIAESMAFYREWECYAAAAKLLGSSRLTPVEQAYLNIFGSTRAQQQHGVTAFELETRIWRVIRFLRAIFDVTVNRGKQSYVDFIIWASAETQLSKEFIHSQCFSFLAMPGYAPAYAICGQQYRDLQLADCKQGVPQKLFNTLVCKMGYYPWTISVSKIEKFPKREIAPDRDKFCDEQ